MKLFAIIANAQAGQLFDGLGQHFGVGGDTAAQATRYFLPAIRKAVEMKAETLPGLIAVLDFLAARRHDRLIADPRMVGHPRVAEEGGRILSFLFPNREFLKKLVAHRAEVLQVKTEVVEAMLPFIAVLAVGAIEQRTRKPLGALVQRLTGGSIEQRTLINPYAALAVQLKLRQQSMSRGLSRVSGLFGGLFGRTERRAAAAA
jgi:hypothetical protein